MGINPLGRQWNCEFAEWEQACAATQGFEAQLCCSQDNVFFY